MGGITAEFHGDLAGKDSGRGELWRKEDWRTIRLGLAIILAGHQS